MSQSLHTRGLTKRWGPTRALAGVDLDFDPGQYTCVMGPSGSGKSTLLRILAGFESPDEGEVQLGDRSLLTVPAHLRPVHTVFQDQALFPHLSVRDNVAFAGTVSGMGARRRRARADALLEEIGLDPRAFADRSTPTLSGGERQRVALARALFDLPAFLLLDEPLSALDHGQRSGLRRKLVALQRDRGIGFIHVTHDPQEAMAVADRLVVLVAGRVAARGVPAELYEQPPTLDVARALGELTPIDGGWIRPELLRPVDQGPGKLEVKELDRVVVGGGWELHLESAAEVLVARVRTPPSAAVTRLDWDDADIMRFDESRRLTRRTSDSSPARPQV